jgi:hypothetical protein
LERRVAVADRLEGIRRLFEVAVDALTTPSPEGGQPWRGRDFMSSDLTYGADRA